MKFSCNTIWFILEGILLHGYFKFLTEINYPFKSDPAHPKKENKTVIIPQNIPKETNANTNLKENKFWLEIFLTSPLWQGLYKVGLAKSTSSGRSLSKIPLTIGGRDVKATCCRVKYKLSIFTEPENPLKIWYQNSTKTDNCRMETKSHK